MKKKVYFLALLSCMLLGALSVSVSAASKLPFSDVKESTWYYENLCDLYSKGIINGFEDGTFKGNNTLKKDQMLKLVITTIVPNANYTKGEGETWFEPYLEVARNYDIEDMPKQIEVTNADGEVYTTYESEDVSTKYNVDIPREEIAIYTLRAYALGINITSLKPRSTLEEADKELRSLYKDYSQISDNAKIAIYELNKLGIMQGDDKGNFNPKKSLSRAEATAIIYRLRKVRDELKTNGNLDMELIDKIASESNGGTDEGTKLEESHPSIEETKYTQKELDELFSSREKLMEVFGYEVKKMSDEDIRGLYKYYCENYLKK